MTEQEKEFFKVVGSVITFVVMTAGGILMIAVHLLTIEEKSLAIQAAKKERQAAKSSGTRKASEAKPFVPPKPLQTPPPDPPLAMAVPKKEDTNVPSAEIEFVVPQRVALSPVPDQPNPRREFKASPAPTPKLVTVKQPSAPKHESTIEPTPSPSDSYSGWLGSVPSAPKLQRVVDEHVTNKPIVRPAMVPAVIQQPRMNQVMAYSVVKTVEKYSARRVVVRQRVR